MELILVISAYLLGSISPASILAGYRGIDLKTGGTKNPGAANVYRLVGPGWGMLTAVLDLLKGAVPVYIAREVFSLHLLMLVVVALAAIIGHNWSLFYKFSGGRGLATTLGTVAVINFYYGFISFVGGSLITVLARKITGYDLRLPYFIYPLFIFFVFINSFNYYYLLYGVAIMLLTGIRAWQVKNR